MLLSHHKGFLIPLAIASAFALQVNPAFAFVNDISSALLPASTAPSGFSVPKHQIYSSFHADMFIKTQPGKVPSPACLSDRSFKKDGWKQGMIETFPSGQSKPTRILTLCAWRFSTVAGAHKAYLFATSALKTDLKPKAAPKRAVKKKTVGKTAGKKAPGKVVSKTKITLKVLSASKIGDESLAVRGGTTVTSYGLYFRRANALIELSYAGPSSLGANTFLNLGKMASSKLR